MVHDNVDFTKVVRVIITKTSSKDSTSTLFNTISVNLYQSYLNFNSQRLNIIITYAEKHNWTK